MFYISPNLYVLVYQYTTRFLPDKKKLSRKKNAERLKPEHIEESGSILGSLRTRMVGIQLGSDQSATNGPLSYSDPDGLIVGCCDRKVVA